MKHSGTLRYANNSLGVSEIGENIPSDTEIPRAQGANMEEGCLEGYERIWLYREGFRDPCFVSFARSIRCKHKLTVVSDVSVKIILSPLKRRGPLIQGLDYRFSARFSHVNQILPLEIPPRGLLGIHKKLTKSAGYGYFLH